MLRYTTCALLFFSGFPSCIHTDEKSVIKTTLYEEEQEEQSKGQKEEKSKDPFSIAWQNEQEEKALIEEDKELNASLNLADHEQQVEVQKWIQFYGKTHKKSFSKLLEEASYYKPMIKSIFRQEGVPTYFYYLPIIESGFQTQAKSHAKAVGIWQFVAPTARRYGLRVDNQVDERMDPIRSTFSAAQYLKALYQVFHSWPLAIAAYNAGEMRIVGSIMSEKNRNFWELARKKKLPKETCHFIPKFIAAALIGNHPEKYGFTIGKTKTPMKAIHGVSFSSHATFTSISKETGVPEQVLSELNSHLKNKKTPRGFPSYMVWIPKNYEISPALAAAVKPEKPVKEIQRPESHHYTVGKGDTLIKIAHKFNIPVKEIRQINRIYGKARLSIGQKIKIKGS